MIEISLPWPDKRLSPNARCHWREKAEAVKEARLIGFFVTWNILEETYRCQPPAGKFSAQYTFNPPDKRRRDKDNFSAAMKSYQDGVADAIGVDDYYFEIEKPIWGDVVKGGKVVLRLEEME